MLTNIPFKRRRMVGQVGSMVNVSQLVLRSVSWDQFSAAWKAVEGSYINIVDWKCPVFVVCVSSPVMQVFCLGWWERLRLLHGSLCLSPAGFSHLVRHATAFVGNYSVESNHAVSPAKLLQLYNLVIHHCGVGSHNHAGEEIYGL